MKLFRTDSWTNVFTRMGTSQDKKEATKFGNITIFDQGTLRLMYRGEGLTKRVVDLAANDMTRRWFKVDGDSEGFIGQKLDELKAKKKINQALRWDRLFGGALIVGGLIDGGGMEEPLNEATLQTIDFLHVFDRYAATPLSYYNDPNNEKYGEVEKFTVSPKRNGAPFVVHESRCLIFDGIDIDDISRQEQQGWGDSVIQAIYERIRGLGVGYNGVEHILDEFIIGILAIKNLTDLLADPEGPKMISDRLNQIDMSKSFLNTVLIDADQESFTKLSSTVAGLEGLIDKLIQSVASVTEYPVTLLMGESPAGLNATGKSDILLYYDSIHAKQETKLQSQLETLCKWIQLCQLGDFRGIELDQWKIVFNPLYEPSETEIVTNRKTVAETDKIYYDMGALYETEIRDSRFGGETYSIDTDLDETLSSALEDKSTQEAKDIKNPPMPSVAIPAQMTNATGITSSDPKGFLNGKELPTKGQ